MRFWLFFRYSWNYPKNIKLITNCYHLEKTPEFCIHRDLVKIAAFKNGKVVVQFKMNY